jgi:phosphatidylglycerol lysyltransferase
VLAPADVPPLLPELARISGDWLAAQGARETRFSRGWFDPAYVRRLPLVVVRRTGRLVAFASLWQTGTRRELAVDLLRYGHDAPRGVRDYLMASIMRWGQANGFAVFNLGTAPLAGTESRPVAPLWSRLDARLPEHGERFGTAHGLRVYKETFTPVWRPQYLASPGGRALPVILANVATLITGGLENALAR